MEVKVCTRYVSFSLTEKRKEDKGLESEGAIALTTIIITSRTIGVPTTTVTDLTTVMPSGENVCLHVWFTESSP